MLVYFCCGKMPGCINYDKEGVDKGYMCLLQIQQLAWHKYDFIGMLIITLVLLGCSVTVLVGSVRGRHHSMLLVSLCSIYVAIAAYAAIK